MRRKNSLRLAALAAGGVATLAVAAPSQASYFSTASNAVCKGAVDLHGLGASTQRDVLLQGWGATLLAPSPGGPNAVGFGYDAGADYANCGVFKTPADGGTKVFDYRASGSGSAIDAFGGKAANDPRSWTDATTGTTYSDFAIGGTDDPPTEQQIAWAEAGPPAHPTEGQLLTIPVAQVAVAAAVRLPDGCQIANNADRSLSRQQADLAFQGVSTTWRAVFGTAVTAISGSGLTSDQCRDKSFKRVVRLDSSGSTFIFKRYLNAASHAAGGSSFDWRDPADGGTLANQTWPNDAGATAVVRGAANGAGSLLDALSAQGENGGIGYGDVSTLRAKSYGWDYSGAYTADDNKLWLRAQRINNDNYNSPAVTNAQVASGSNAGAACNTVTYDNQPATLGESWQPASAVLTPTDFPGCGLTYQMTWLWGFDTENSRFKAVQAGATEGEWRAVRDYLRYVLGVIRPGVGPSKLAPLGYSKLPTDVANKAIQAANKVGWLRSGSTDGQPEDPVLP